MSPLLPGSPCARLLLVEAKSSAGSMLPIVIQGTGVEKIKALLLAARTGLNASARELALEFKKPPHAPGEAVPDRSPAITSLIEKLKTLCQAVEAVTVEGAAAVTARDLTVRAVLETEQSLGKLAESYAATD